MRAHPPVVEIHNNCNDNKLANTFLCTAGETWNLMKIGYQLKQVRERLAKGLVDKGILRTEKRNFLLFDMATHPVADGGAKEEIRRRVRNVLTQRTVVLNGTQWLPENLEFRYTRTIAMVCAAYAANVLENALSTLGHEARERAFAQTDELLAEYSQWPFGKKATGNGIGANLPQVISEVSGIPVKAAVRCFELTSVNSAGGQQGQGQGAPARSRRRLSERLHPTRLPSVTRCTLSARIRDLFNDLQQTLLGTRGFTNGNITSVSMCSSEVEGAEEELRRKDHSWEATRQVARPQRTDGCITVWTSSRISG